MQPVTIWRRISQLGFFLLTGEWLAIGWLRCPFGVPFVSCQSCPSTDCPGRWLQLPILGLIGLSALSLGRGFCGWACPMGLIMDVLGKIPKLRATISARFTSTDRWLKPLKYVALAAVLYLIFALNVTDDRPYAYVVRSPSVFNLQAIALAQALGVVAYRVRMWIVIGVLVVALIITRVWCRYLCPLGALLGLFNKFSLFRIAREREDLPRCGKYPRECVQHTMPGTTDCVMCGECVQGCPRKLLRLRPRHRSR
jgi:ferredoxin-type protein NapH